MSWASTRQIIDIDETQEFEFQCDKCDKTFHKSGKQLIEKYERFLWLDQVEDLEPCRDKSCFGSVKMRELHEGKYSSFVGGIP